MNKKFLALSIPNIAAAVGLVAILLLSGASHAAANRAPSLVTCAPSALSISPKTFGVDMSGTSVIYTVLNTGQAPCALSGVPTYTLLDPTGAPATTVDESQPFGAGSEVDLNSGSATSFSAHLGNCFTPRGLVGGGAATPAWTFAGQSRAVSEAGVSVPTDCSSVSAAVSPIEPGVMTAPVGFTATAGSPPTCGGPLGPCARSSASPINRGRSGGR